MRRLVDRLRHRAAAFAHDLLWVPLAWLGAYWLRFNLERIPAEYLATALKLVPVVVVIQAAVFWRLGLYRGVWRFASLPDMLRIGKAVAVGTVLIAVAALLLTRAEHVPRSVFVFYAGLLGVLLSVPRAAYRWRKDHHLYLGAAKRALIVGAGHAGETLARDLLRSSGWGYTPIGFVDDDPRKRGREIHGVRVFGSIEAVPRLVTRLEIDVLLLAIPTASAADMRRIVALCEATGAPLRTLPRMTDILQGHALVQGLREVSIEDLLGRDPVTLDWQAIRRALEERTVMLTGGGGSIGSELCRQVARLGPRRLVIVENSEFNLFRIDRELRQRFPDLALEARLGDVRDPEAIRFLFGEFKPEVVFHAAAYKHVPMLQAQAREAVRNNILGTRNVALLAAGLGCDTFVLISTDKAVNPTNVMGATKRVAEMVCQNLDRHVATRFITVRFGNVLDSAGSVVPIFREQIAAGGPVTVTDREVSRYFMTIPEASQLILQAAAAGEGGEIFVLDMGEPIKIRYLAEQMIRLAGKVPDVDVGIRYTGLRPGEKLFEELFHDEEHYAATAHPKIFLATARVVPWPELEQGLKGLARAVRDFDETAITSGLRVLVPEFGAGAEADNVIPLQRTR